MQPAELAVERAVRSSASTLVGLAVHELNNRLAVMRETVGLLEDLARAGKSGVAGTARAHASLDDQIGRALNTMNALTGLGTALGISGDGFDAGAVVGDLLGLIERWARQRELRVESEIAADLPRAAGEPALLLCLLHRVLERGAAACAAGGTIGVRLRRDGAGIRVDIGPAPRGPQAVAAGEFGDEEIDRRLAERLGGRLLVDGKGVTTIALTAAG